MSTTESPLFRLLLTLLASPRSEKGWVWLYTCDNGRCVRNGTGPVEETIAHTNSLDVCKLTCGQYGALWPHPTGLTHLSKDIVGFHPSHFTFNLRDISGRSSMLRPSPTKSYIHKVTQNFVANLMTTCGEPDMCNKTETDVTIKITTTSSDMNLDWQTDESYALQIFSTAMLLTDDHKTVDVNISAVSVYGARHSLETLGQLMSGYLVESIYYMVMVAAAEIQDKPMYSHRGLMLDTARHFIPLSMIKKTINGMSMNKMNVLHWHATDSHSFPLSLPSVPELAKYGAYSAQEVYTRAEIGEIVNYGKERGVRIVLEVNTPGRTSNGWHWGPSRGLGELALCIDKQPWRDYCSQPPCGQLNPINPNTYIVLRRIFKDLSSVLTTGEMFHMGGDEVSVACWKSAREIQQWMTRQGWGINDIDFLHLWSAFQDNQTSCFDMEVRTTGMRSPIILWSSEITRHDSIQLDPSRYVIQTWENSEDGTTRLLLLKHLRVIVSPSDKWHLSRRFVEDTPEYNSWEVHYDHTPPEPSDYMLGGEAVLWSKTVDGQNLEPKVWPRAAAVAERLWSNPETPSSAALTRFLQHRERMVNRGIRAEAVNEQWCSVNEVDCVNNS